MKITSVLLFTLVPVILVSCGCDRSLIEDPPEPIDTTSAPGIHHSKVPVTLETLLDEIVSYDEAVYFPAPSYTSKQFSSYDRRSTKPGESGWFANNDNNGYVRIGTFQGRSEKVIFEQTGPGAITRIWTAGVINDITLRFYFDDEASPGFTIQGYDLTRTPFIVPDGLVFKHMHYTTKGGTTLYLPIPYSRKCIITASNTNINYAFHINYRTYDAGTEVKTFTTTDSNALLGKMNQVVQKLKSPANNTEGAKVEKSSVLDGNGLLTVNLPEGAHAVKLLSFKISNFNSPDYALLMRRLIVKMTFDGKQSVWAPLSDFSGGGMGAPSVANWFMSANGVGNFTSRWVMPYRKNAKIEIENISQLQANVIITAYVTEQKWYENTLYFHCSWKQERGLSTTIADLTNNHGEWNSMILTGKGVYKADILSLYNHNTSWYGEGDEKIYIDDESFPSHFGTGTEDYYNTSFAPVVVFHTPFGGATRADNTDSNGYNTWLRTRNLDGITFNSNLRFYWELLSWTEGVVDYSSTVFWYGDLNATAIGTSGIEEALVNMPDR